MKIGKKIFLTLLGLSLTSLITSTVTGLHHLVETKNDIAVAQDAQADQLINTNIEIITAANEEIVATLSRSCAESIESKFTAITEQTLTVRNFLNSLYENGVRTVSSFPDDMRYLQPGVLPDTIELEFSLIKSARDLMSSIMEANDNIIVYYVSESGLLISGIYIDYSEGQNIDRRERQWYRKAKESRKVFWTPIYTDASTGAMTVTCSVPVIDKNGVVMGVVGCDILIDPLVDDVIAPRSDIIEYTFLMDQQGNDFVGSISDKNLSDFVGGETSRKELSADILNKKDSEGLYNNGAVMVGYSTIPITGWSVGAVIDCNRISAPAKSIGNAIEEARHDFHRYLDSKIQKSILVSIITAIVMLIFVLIASRITSGSITKPLELLTEGVRKVSDSNLTHSIDLSSGDELEQLANSFNHMTFKLRKYIDNLAMVTAEKERIATELNIAAQIQADMLPRIFPAFPDRSEFELYAMMRPAKEVGGDFYDFFLIDDDHLGIVIADVSGKGVAAALFMVIAKTLIKNCAQKGNTPAEILETVNNQLCESNDAGMFVTVFLGILQISTGKFCYANAGHNPPLICRSDGDFDFLRTKPGFVLAGMENIRYRQDEIILFEGDILFFYTDGVTEAVNERNDLFAEKRLLECINRYKRCQLNRLLELIKMDVDSFADGVEQADDITMMAVKNVSTIPEKVPENGAEASPFSGT